MVIALTKYKPIKLLSTDTCTYTVLLNSTKMQLNEVFIDASKMHSFVHSNWGHTNKVCK